jgi:predicted CXXCH cytochrome family protein
VLFLGAVLVTSVALTFTPGVSSVIAISPSPDPAASEPVPTPDPTPDPTPASEPVASPDPTPSPSPAPTPFAPDTVGADGGVITSGAVSIAVPAGTVSGPTTFVVTPAADLPAFDGAPPLLGFTLAARAAETLDPATGSPVPGQTLASFAVPVTVSTSTMGLDLTNTDPADLRLASMGADGAWAVLATSLRDAVLIAETSLPGTFGVVIDSSARAVAIQLDHTSDAPAAGRHRIEPDATLRIDIAARPATTIEGAQFVERLPAGWTVLDAGTGVWNDQLGIVTWDVGTLSGQETVSRSLAVRAPWTSPVDGAAAFPAIFDARLTYRGGALDASPINVLVSPAIVIEHRTFGRIDPTSLDVSYLAEDAPVDGVAVFEVVRLRFQVRNADTIETSLAPQLEFRAAGVGSFARVPATDPVLEVPFYVSREWRWASPAHDGAVSSGHVEDLGTAELLDDNRAGTGERPVVGRRIMGLNPGPAVTLPGGSFTEVEFSVHTAIAAVYLAPYEFRLSDGGRPLAGAAIATLTVEARPPLELTPGQRYGTPESGAIPRYSLAWAAVGAAPKIEYALLLNTAPVAALAASFAAPLSPHGGYTLTTDACASCHSSHAAQSPNLTVSATPAVTLCFSCHDGSTNPDGSPRAVNDTKLQYAITATFPDNTPATSSYYRHDPTVATNHSAAGMNEFGSVTNRHSECADCHDPHSATNAPSTETAAGWTTPGQQTGISGVSVVNGAAGTAPVYTFEPIGAAPVSLEYQLCLKCHSGFTNLLTQTAAAPSTWALDKGVEMNPTNGSTHPIEGPGSNRTAAMRASLAGTSAYKLWTFTETSTIRCLNCHGDSRQAITTVPAPVGYTAPAAGADLAPHAVGFRGILMNNYRDRALKPAGELFSSADFALCFQCHGEDAFAPGGGSSQTNYIFHRKHTTGLFGGSVPGDIDVAGAGRGNAICAECHFRLHSDAFPVGQQTRTAGPADAPGSVPGTRLVNFAPNVQPRNGVLAWAAKRSTTQGSCTLVCHGVSHNNARY